MVDLIPNEYRRARRLRRQLRGFAWSVALLLAGVGVARAGLNHLLGAERAVLARAEAADAQAAAERSRVAALTARKQQAEARLRLLDGMRGEAPVGELFLVIDDALDERVRFDELAFTREPEPTGAGSMAASAASPASGRPSVSPTGAAPAGSADTRPGALARGRIEVRGHTPDHGVLARFIRQLRAGSGIAEVRLLDTTMRGESEAHAVGFNLLVLLDDPRQGDR